jgi:hypothetical protein
MPGDSGGRPLFVKKDAAFFLLFLLVFLFLFRAFFFAGGMFFERDTTVIEIPARKLCAELLESGNFALWTDDMGMGQPFLANPKNAVLYPTTLLYLVLPFFTAFRLHYLLHVLVCWLGLFTFGKTLRLSARASFLGASVFVLSGMFLSSFEFYNHVAALAWMPWVLVAASREARSPALRVCGTAVLWGLMILAGTPEVLLMTALLVAALLLFSGKGRGRRTALICLSLVFSLFLTAAQILPSVELSRRSERRDGLSPIWPLEMVQLPNLVFPHFLGNDRQPGRSDFWGWHMFDKHYPLYYSFYVGFGAFLLFLFGSGRPWDDRRKWLLAAFVLLFLVSNGRYSPFFFLYRTIPFLSLMRYPVKFFLGSVFALSFLAAIGYDDLAASRGPKKTRGGTLAGLAASAVFLYFVFKGPVLGFLTRLFVIDREASVRALGRSLETGLLVLALATALIAASSFRRTPKALVSWGLAALVVFDLAAHNRHINPVVDESFFSRPEILSTLGSPVRVFREESYQPDLKEKIADNPRFLAYLRESLYPYTAMTEGVRYVLDGDFYGLFPRSHNDLRRKILALEKEDLARALDLLGCAVRIGERALLDRDAELVSIEGVPTAVERVAERDIRPTIVFETVTATSPDEKIRQFLDPGFDPERRAIVEKDLRISANAAEAGAELTILEESPGRGRYRTILSNPGILVIPGNYARGWTARLDGERTEVFEANLFSKGVAAPEGRHEIVLRYSPQSFRLGGLISLVSLGGLLGFLGLAWAGKRMRKRPRA